jgi:hypothetical protein
VKHENDILPVWPLLDFSSNDFRQVGGTHVFDGIVLVDDDSRVVRETGRQTNAKKGKHVDRGSDSHRLVLECLGGIPSLPNQPSGCCQNEVNRRTEVTRE